MQTKTISVEDFAEENLKSWKNALKTKDKKEDAVFPVITVNMQAGSRGYMVAKTVADRLGFALFHTELLDEMAKTGKVSRETLAAIEKGRHKGLGDFVASLLDDHYLHANTYMKFLRDAIASIGKKGRSVIVGRGGNFILPPEQRLAVRVISTMDARIANVRQDFKVSVEEAKKRIKARGAARKSFIKENFHQDIQDPENYDLIVNTARLSVEACAEAVIGAYIGAQSMARFGK